MTILEVQAQNGVWAKSYDTAVYETNLNGLKSLATLKFRWNSIALADPSKVTKVLYQITTVPVPSNLTDWKSIGGIEINAVPAPANNGKTTSGTFEIGKGTWDWINWNALTKTKDG